MKRIALGAHFPSMGQHVAAWMHPQAQIDGGHNFRWFVRMAQAAERARFDFVFMADTVGTRDGDMRALSRWPQYMAHFEPISLLSATAAVTEHVGLVCTASTSYYEPYNVARLFGTLDHISEGRAGWNVVTTANAAASHNFSRDDHYDVADRYKRAREFVEVVKGLWDSWEDDAFLRNRATGTYFDPAKLHPLNHEGRFFKVRGPLNLARPPQGHPVIAQAGASEDGMELAAETAEVVFQSKSRMLDAQGFYAEVKGRMGKYGRAPGELKMCAGLNVTVAPTEAEAREKFAYMQSLIHPDVGRELVSVELGGADLSDLPLDGPVPWERIPTESVMSPSRLAAMRALVARENLSLRQLYQRYAGSRGSAQIIGTPIQVADMMQNWVEREACDGFIIQGSYFPGGFDDFCQMVVPELQRRGLMRTEYETRTLRNHLGLPRPRNRFAA